MSYAVLQTELNAPTIEQLRRVLRFVPGMTQYDAPIIGRDAFGILVKDFSEQQAGALHSALRGEGVETEIVDQSFLPALPPTHFIHRCECLPEHLLIYDPLGRGFALPWQHVMLVAAGAVQLIEFTQHRRLRQQTTDYRRHGGTEVEYDTVSREEQRAHLIADVIVAGGALRYSITADKFNFAYLAQRNTGSVVANFSLLVRDLIQFSPNALLNQGAATMRADATQTFRYPSKNAFYEEIIWMLWQQKKAV